MASSVHAPKIEAYNRALVARDFTAALEKFTGLMGLPEQQVLEFANVNRLDWTYEIAVVEAHLTADEVQAGEAFLNSVAQALAARLPPYGKYVGQLWFGGDWVISGSQS
ncbi:MAG: hypothetical protein ACTSX8_02755 [Alphaproteobacteria bacterium]